MTNNLLEAIQKGISEALDFNIEDSNDDFSIQKTKPSYASVKSIDNAQKEINKYAKENDFNSAFNVYITYRVKYAVEDRQELIQIVNKIKYTKDLPIDFSLNWIDVSNVTDMSNLFNGDGGLDKNYDISEWDVSNVTNMSGMFAYNKNFSINLHLENWDVSNVTDMSCMFINCTKFNCDISKWDVSNVTDMNNMFCGCINFNQQLNDWNVSNVTDMSGMFRLCKVFNQPLDKWNVYNVTNMDEMFIQCNDFNQPLSKWNVCNVEDTRYMFFMCNKFKQNLSNWQLDNIKYMNSMFNVDFPYKFKPCLSSIVKYDHENCCVQLSDNWAKKFTYADLKALHDIVCEKKFLNITYDQFAEYLRKHIEEANENK